MLGKRGEKVMVIEMRFGLTPDKRSFDAVFILRRMHEEYHTRGKCFMCVMWI